MATLTIRNIDKVIKERLRVLAAMRGHSMEEEARLILRRAVGGVTAKDLWSRSRALFDGDDGVELELPERTGSRSVPDFGET